MASNDPIAVRSFANKYGYDVNWDPTTRNISLGKKGFAPMVLNKDAYTNTTGTAYMSPEQMQSFFAGQAANPTPATDAYSTQYNAVSKMADPQRAKLAEIQAAKQAALDARLKARTATMNEATRQARLSLEANKKADWNRMTKSALHRDPNGGGLVSYEQRKVADTYAPQFENLAASSLADLEALAAEFAGYDQDLLATGLTNEGNLEATIAQNALDQYNKTIEGESATRQAIADALQLSRENAIADASLTGKYNGQDTLDALLTRAQINSLNRSNQSTTTTGPSDVDLAYTQDMRTFLSNLGGIGDANLNDQGVEINTTANYERNQAWKMIAQQNAIIDNTPYYSDAQKKQMKAALAQQMNELYPYEKASTASNKNSSGILSDFLSKKFPLYNNSSNSSLNFDAYRQ